MNHKLRQTLIYLYDLLESVQIQKDTTDCLKETQKFYELMDTIETLTTAINLLEKLRL